MEGGDGKASRGFGHQGRQPLLHLGRGPAAEGDGQALLRGHAALGDRWARRWVSVRVLPVPGPATMRSGPSRISAAARCSGSRRDRRPEPPSPKPSPPGPLSRPLPPSLTGRGGTWLGRSAQRRGFSFSAGRVGTSSAPTPRDPESSLPPASVPPLPVREGGRGRERGPGVRARAGAQTTAPPPTARGSRPARTAGSPRTRRRTPPRGGPGRPAGGRAPRRAARPPARATSSRGIRSRMSISGPSRATSCENGLLDGARLGPDAVDLRRGSPAGARDSGTDRSAPARASSGRSASSSTRCITPTVSGLPQAGQSPCAPPRLRRLQAHAAGAVAVQVVLALLGEELDRAAVPLPRLQRPADREVVEVGVEGAGLAAQHGRRVGVRVADQGEAVEPRDPPVHRRIGGEPRLHREDVRRQIAVALLHRVEARLRAQDGEPGRPDVGGDQIGVRPALQGDLQQVPRVEPEDGPAVRVEVADRARASRAGAPPCRGWRRRSGGGPSASGPPSCRWWRSPPPAGTGPARGRTAAGCRSTSRSISGRSRNSPGSAGTSLVRISSNQAGWVKSPVPTTVIPFRRAQSARCSRSASRLVAREYLEWTWRSA